jgi:hypothetical protein
MEQKDLSAFQKAITGKGYNFENPHIIMTDDARQMTLLVTKPQKNNKS